MTGGGRPTGDWETVSTYREAVEVLRSPNMSADTGGDSDREHFRGGTLLRIDGPAHLRRRRAVNPLVRGSGLEALNARVIGSAIQESIAELVTRSKDGHQANADLVTFAYRLFLRVAGAVIGLDAAVIASGIDDLETINREINQGASDAHLELLYGTPARDVLARAVAAKEAFRKRHYEPSLRTRKALIDKVAAGRLPESELPDDLLTLIASDSGDLWPDPEAAFREAQTVFRAGINTSTQALAFTIDELFGWLVDHPEDGGKLADDRLLLAVVEEALRLHPSSPQSLRRASADVVLSSGRSIAAGRYVVIELDAANRDPAVYGNDAHMFNPWRQPAPGIYRYGLAFSSGPHMCFGFPVVMGQMGTDGTLVRTLRALLAAGVEPDADRPPTRRLNTHKDTFISYPIRFGGAYRDLMGST